MTAGRELILVADDDDDIVRFLEANLRLEGFDVLSASDGEQVIHDAHERRPDLILLDVMMPNLDGLQVCHRLREDARTKHISVIMVTAKAQLADKVSGLTAGADDYIIKPFDPIELVARVKSSLRRSREMRAVNPLTQLPGNVQVQEEVARRVSDASPFAVMYVDLDNFKSFNDHYGFLRGDEAIKALAGCVRRALQDRAGDSFLGHVGGDDFLAVVEAAAAEDAANSIIDYWDARAAALYDRHDAERGYIEVANRRNELNRFPVATVSIGIATNAHRPIGSHWEAAEIASEMKSFAKKHTRSTYAVDRRSAPPPPPPT